MANKKRPKRVLVCGSRWWRNVWPILRELRCLPKSVKIIIHGGARGVDRLAGEVAKGLGFKVIEVPANWKTNGKAAGIIRNQRMLEMLEEGDIVLAFHEDLQHSKGTKDMLIRARKAGYKTGEYNA